MSRQMRAVMILRGLAPCTQEVGIAAVARFTIANICHLFLTGDNDANQFNRVRFGLRTKHVLNLLLM